MTSEECPAFEKTSEIRREYVDGELYAMAGTSKDHNLINDNLYILLRSKLCGSSFQTFTKDVKVKLKEGRKYFI